MQTIQLTLTFIPFEEQTPEIGRMIICLRRTGANRENCTDVETLEVDDDFLDYRDDNWYTHWCYLPVIKNV